MAKSQKLCIFKFKIDYILLWILFSKYATLNTFLDIIIYNVFLHSIVFYNTVYYNRISFTFQSCLVYKHKITVKNIAPNFFQSFSFLVQEKDAWSNKANERYFWEYIWGVRHFPWLCRRSKVSRISLTVRTGLCVAHESKKGNPDSIWAGNTKLSSFENPGTGLTEADQSNTNMNLQYQKLLKSYLLMKSVFNSVFSIL